MKQRQSCFNCLHENDINEDNPYADPYCCQTCRCIDDTGKEKTNWVAKTVDDLETYNQCEIYVIQHILNKTLKEAHTRKELAAMLRILEPYLVKQSPYACQSMCKQRMCDHLEFIVKLHTPNRNFMKWIGEQLKKGVNK